MKDHMRFRPEALMPPQLFAMSSPKCETYARREPQKQISTLSIPDLEGVLSISYTYQNIFKTRSNPS